MANVDKAVAGHLAGQEPVSGTPHVEFMGVGKSYDGVTQVVRDLDLTVYEGEFLTLLGPSGSGKTTCLMMLAGFETPSAGRIRIGGRRVDDVPPRRRNIGMVFQNYALFPHMTVGANLAFPLEVRGIDRVSVVSRVRRALQLVRLDGFEDRKPGALSGGQQQRVAIARALVFEPSLVLMDEPLGALDRRLREDMQYEIRRIQRTLGVTVIYVTHDQQEAMAMSDRVAVFNRGCIEQVAAPEVLYEEPERGFVATFIGDNNLLHGRREGPGRLSGTLRAPTSSSLATPCSDAMGKSACVRADCPGRWCLRWQRRRVRPGRRRRRATRRVQPSDCPAGSKLATDAMTTLAGGTGAR